MTITYMHIKTVLQGILAAFGLWAVLALGGLAHATHEESTFSQGNQRGSEDPYWRQKEDQNRREEHQRQEQHRRDYEESGRRNDSRGYQAPTDQFGSFSDGKFKSCERANDTVYCY